MVGRSPWEDNVKTSRFIYSFRRLFSSAFFNADLLKSGETAPTTISLSPKWKGKIGFLTHAHPAWVRVVGILMKIKGKDFYKTRPARFIR